MISLTEKRIVQTILEDAVANGAKFFIIVDEDGEEEAMTLEDAVKFHGAVEIWNAVAMTGNGDRLGWFLFIAGNGPDVLSDYSDNEWSHRVVSRAMSMVDRIYQKQR